MTTNEKFGLLQVYLGLIESKSDTIQSKNCQEVYENSVRFLSCHWMELDLSSARIFELLFFLGDHVKNGSLSTELFFFTGTLACLCLNRDYLLYSIDKLKQISNRNLENEKSDAPLETLSVALAYFMQNSSDDKIDDCISNLLLKRIPSFAFYNTKEPIVRWMYIVHYVNLQFNSYSQKSVLQHSSKFREPTEENNISFFTILETMVQALGYFRARKKSQAFEMYPPDQPTVANWIFSSIAAASLRC